MITTTTAVIFCLACLIIGACSAILAISLVHAGRERDPLDDEATDTPFLDAVLDESPRPVRGVRTWQD